MAGWRGTCRALNWVCMLYRWLAGELVMIAMSRWPWWQLHAGRPRPACLFLSGPGTLSRQLLSPVLITPSCPPCCLATPRQPLHNTSSLLPHRNLQMFNGSRFRKFKKGKKWFKHILKSTFPLQKGKKNIRKKCCSSSAAVQCYLTEAVFGVG